MALIRRYGLYVVMAAAFIFMLYSLSFPYDPDNAGGTNSRPDPSQPYKSYNWAKIPMKNPVESLIKLPGGNPNKLPKIQHDFRRYGEKYPRKEKRRSKEAVSEMLEVLSSAELDARRVEAYQRGTE
jgi:mannosyl-oligosaccharide alpha-1,2-mannosidase